MPARPLPHCHLVNVSLYHFDNVILDSNMSLSSDTQSTLFPHVDPTSALYPSSTLRCTEPDPSASKTKKLREGEVPSPSLATAEPPFPLAAASPAAAAPNAYYPYPYDATVTYLYSPGLGYRPLMSPAYPCLQQPTPLVEGPSAAPSSAPSMLQPSPYLRSVYVPPSGPGTRPPVVNLRQRKFSVPYTCPQPFFPLQPSSHYIHSNARSTLRPVLDPESNPSPLGYAEPPVPMTMYPPTRVNPIYKDLSASFVASNDREYPSNTLKCNSPAKPMEYPLSIVCEKGLNVSPKGLNPEQELVLVPSKFPLPSRRQIEYSEGSTTEDQEAFPSKHASHRSHARRSKSKAVNKNHATYKCQFPNCYFKSHSLSELRSHLNEHDKSVQYCCAYPKCSYLTPRKHNFRMHIIRNGHECEANRVQLATKVNFETEAQENNTATHTNDDEEKVDSLSEKKESESQPLPPEEK